MSPRRAKTESNDIRTATAPAGEAPLAIIAGSGTLPLALAAAALAKGRPVHVLGIRGEAEQSISRFPHTWLKWGEVGKLFATLDEQGCRDLVIIGAVTRPDLANVKFDFGAIRNLPFLLSLGVGGDDHVLSSVVRFLEGKGYRVRGAGEVAPELLAGAGTLGAKVPSPEDRADIDLGFRVVTALGRLDIGQAAVVSKGHVLAVEAAEGTDAMLARCAELRQAKRKPPPWALRRAGEGPEAGTGGAGGYADHRPGHRGEGRPCRSCRHRGRSRQVADRRPGGHHRRSRYRGAVFVRPDGHP